MTSVEISDNYAYVILTAFMAWCVMIWQTRNVWNARLKYKIHYPVLYATKEDSPDSKIFNCIQRVSQNTHEAFPSFIAFHLLAGIKFPMFTSICGLIWVAGRITYTLGYSTGHPEKRVPGLFGHFGHFATILSVIYWALQMTGILP